MANLRSPKTETKLKAISFAIRYTIVVIICLSTNSLSAQFILPHYERHYNQYLPDSMLGARIIGNASIPNLEESIKNNQAISIAGEILPYPGLRSYAGFNLGTSIMEEREKFDNSSIVLPELSNVGFVFGLNFRPYLTLKSTMPKPKNNLQYTNSELLGHLTAKDSNGNYLHVEHTKLFYDLREITPTRKGVLIKEADIFSEFYYQKREIQDTLSQQYSFNALSLKAGPRYIFSMYGNNYVGFTAAVYYEQLWISGQTSKEDFGKLLGENTPTRFGGLGAYVLLTFEKINFLFEVKDLSVLGSKDYRDDKGGRNVQGITDANFRVKAAISTEALKIF